MIKMYHFIFQIIQKTSFPPPDPPHCLTPNTTLSGAGMGEGVGLDCGLGGLPRPRGVQWIFNNTGEVIGSERVQEGQVGFRVFLIKTVYFSQKNRFSHKPIFFCFFFTFFSELIRSERVQGEQVGFRVFFRFY